MKCTNCGDSFTPGRTTRDYPVPVEAHADGYCCLLCREHGTLDHHWAEREARIAHLHQLVIPQDHKERTDP